DNLQEKLRTCLELRLPCRCEHSHCCYCCVHVFRLSSNCELSLRTSPILLRAHPSHDMEWIYLRHSIDRRGAQFSDCRLFDVQKMLCR
ncbi:hypothetical protein PMAYCL1PPCAC_08438, partial [Pristionchus mayeri]